MAKAWLIVELLWPVVVRVVDFLISIVRLALKQYSQFVWDSQNMAATSRLLTQPKTMIAIERKGSKGTGGWQHNEGEVDLVFRVQRSWMFWKEEKGF